MLFKRLKQDMDQLEIISKNANDNYTELWEECNGWQRRAESAEKELALREASTLELYDELEELKKECSHWKANHACEVKRARLLRDRLDLPLERITAYDRVLELETENVKLKEEVESHMSHELEMCTLIGDKGEFIFDLKTENTQLKEQWNNHKCDLSSNSGLTNAQVQELQKEIDQLKEQNTIETGDQVHLMVMPLPCPFCGGTDIEIYVCSNDSWIKDIVASCDGCGSRVETRINRQRYIKNSNVDEAKFDFDAQILGLEKWNTRHNSRLTDAQAQELQKEITEYKDRHYHLLSTIAEWSDKCNDLQAKLREREEVIKRVIGIIPAQHCSTCNLIAQIVREVAND